MATYANGTSCQPTHAHVGTSRHNRSGDTPTFGTRARVARVYNGRMPTAPTAPTARHACDIMGAGTSVGHATIVAPTHRAAVRVTMIGA